MAIREAQRDADDAQVEVARNDDIAQHFEDVTRLLATLDVDKTWKAATDVERPVLIDEFIEEITVLPDYLDVNVHGAPPVHVLYQEVGLKESGFDRVGGVCVSEGLVEQIPIGGSNPGTWKSRRMEATRVRAL